MEHTIKILKGQRDFVVKKVEKLQNELRGIQRELDDFTAKEKELTTAIEILEATGNISFDEEPLDLTAMIKLHNRKVKEIRDKKHE